MSALNRVLAVLFALVLLAAGILVPIEIALAFLEREPVLPWPDWAANLASTPWNHATTIAVALALAVVGLALVFSQLKPRRPDNLALRTQADGIRVATTRRSLQRSLEQAATGVDGVSSATARVRSRSATLRATSPLRQPTGLEQAVQHAATRRLDDFQLAAPVRLRTSLRHREES